MNQIKKTVKNNARKNMVSAFCAVILATAISTAVCLVVVQTRTVYGDDSHTLQDRNGKILGTAASTEEVDLLGLPALGDADVYDNIQQLSLYCSGNLEGYTVTGYSWKDATTMSFYTSRNTVVVLHNGQIKTVSGGNSATCTVDPPTSDTRRLGGGKPRRSGFARVAVNVKVESVKMQVTTSTRTTTPRPMYPLEPTTDTGTGINMAAFCKDAGWTAQTDPTGELCCVEMHRLKVDAGGAGAGCCPHGAASDAGADLEECYSLELGPALSKERCEAYNRPGMVMYAPHARCQWIAP